MGINFESDTIRFMLRTSDAVAEGMLDWFILNRTQGDGFRPLKRNYCDYYFCTIEVFAVYELGTTLL